MGEQVLFEWDTYLSSFMAAVTDKWTARSNIIRMTKSLNYQVSSHTRARARTHTH